MKKIPVLLLCACLGICACQKQHTPSMNPGQQALLQVYVRLFELRSTYALTDSAYVDSTRAICGRFGLTPQEFRQALADFRQTPEQWSLFFDQAAVLIKERQDRSADTR